MRTGSELPASVKKPSAAVSPRPTRIEILEERDRYRWEEEE
jgi:hypothetical protein